MSSKALGRLALTLLLIQTGFEAFTSSPSIRSRPSAMPFRLGRSSVHIRRSWPNSHSTHTVYNDPSFGTFQELVSGPFPDTLIVSMEWRTNPLREQIPVPFLPGVLHWVSRQKLFACVKDKPASRDLFHSSLYFRLWGPRRLPRWLPRLLRTLFTWPGRFFPRLRRFMTYYCKAEFGAGSSGPNLRVEYVLADKFACHPEELERVVKFPLPPSYRSFQEAVLMPWSKRSYAANPLQKSNCNQFVRACLDWAENAAA